ncbi:hypothetical protein BCU70_05085 [Vibrio sp. 10N.286.49.C2]|uniref:DeoR/GlpR family DNA-binding transcription regulator n=1 Tax=unclassified Vibrio TaxID=2614977 RepID=UPI000C852B42|nr:MULTISPECIES: DeoR/GlpR family DNA-binding transcription regulator [unclassified Vibrio]PMH33856.1 hypothetical protein BCU70_05085 [Vibrio sp. 10N.286.49.C2]PMH44114.1 hypothetical protein BCU66_03995 [Vibrio sp. 10N.286.49.B1]PMH80937.1 hypothetical protein BCU58_22470 [Vibrio sp. 10N.286.48.B7]
MTNCRKPEILTLLDKNGTITTNALAKLFSVTPQTICRDINELCDQGQARRVHGGVTLPASMDNTHYNQRISNNSQGKALIAKIAARHILPGQTVFLGYGSTTANLASLISIKSPIKVITNNLDVATALENSNSEVWLSGGRVRNRQRDVTGYATANFLNSFRADIAFCGVGAIDKNGDLLEFNYEEAELSRVMLSNAKQKVILADHTKLGRHASVFCEKLANIDILITDIETQEIKQLCQKHSVKIISN